MEKQSGLPPLINNDFYETLGERWYSASDHPVALLRAENAKRTSWVSEEISKHLGKTAAILDVGCGAGFLTNHLAKKGYSVTGIDLSQNSLDVAQKHDSSQTVRYLYGNAYKLPFADASFDCVCAMDILEHVDHPQQLIHEASRVLKPGGLFFFHTFNRTVLSYWIVIKGVEWFVKNTPPNMHIHSLFITPQELGSFCEKEDLHIKTIQGFIPCFWKLPFWKMILTRKVPEDFSFAFVKNLSTGYCGVATKS